MIMVADGNIDIYEFFERLGWSLKNLETVYSSEFKNFKNEFDRFVKQSSDLSYNISVKINESQDIDLPDIINTINAIGKLFIELKILLNELLNIYQQSELLLNELKDLPYDLTNYFLLNYIYNTSYTVYSILTFFNIILEEQNAIVNIENKQIRIRNYNSKFKLRNFGAFIKSPNRIIEDLYFNNTVFDNLENATRGSQQFFSRLMFLLDAFGINYRLGDMDADSITKGLIDYFGNNLRADLRKKGIFSIYKSIPILKINTTTNELDEVWFGLGSHFGFLEKQPNGDNGLYVMPFGDMNLSHSTEKIDILIRSKLSPDGFIVNKNFNLKSILNNIDVYIDLTTTFKVKVVDGKKEPSIIFGTNNGSRIETNEYGFKIKLATNDLGIYFFSNNTHLSVSSDDIFLKTLLVNKPIEGNFSIAIGYSNRNGFHFSGSGGLELNIPTHQKIGPIDLSEINLGIQPSDKGIAIKAAANIGATLGPLKINIKGLGLQARTNFPSDASGNLGLIDLGIGIKPPTGIGIAIDASAIKGAGFLAFNPEKGEYSGVFYLNVLNKFTVKIIGLLNTKRPDGQPGFSLFFIITAEFPAPGFQLGFGFALMGIGGLLGVNRGISETQLLESVSNHSLESLLFPESKSEEAFLAQMPAIVQNIAGIFPVTEGGYLFGALAKITWGTPTILTVDLGIVLEFLTGGGGEKVNEGDATGFNIYMMGVLHCSLPDPSAPIIQLKAVFAGALSFQKKELWFFMAIEDSRILSFTISGEMLLQISWGSQPDFLLTMGGFFPGFRAANLKKQDIKRLAISFLDTDFARISAEYYFALTPNTVQFGAKLQARFALDPLEVTGVLEFDTLIQFNPFHFVVHFGADFEVKVYGHTLFGVGVQANVEGPNPFHVWGTVYVKFKIIFTIKISKDFDVTFGDSASEAIPPDINVWEDLLKPAIEAKESWAALPQLNYSISEKVSVSNEEEGLLILHPFGRLQMHQNAVPLGINIQKVGSRKATNEETFTIKSVFEQSVETLKLEQSKQLFAPSQFKKYSDEDKLSLPAFEEFNNGFILPDSEIYFPDKDKYHSRDLRYENIYIKGDTKKRTPSDIMGLLSQWSAQKRGVTGFLESAKTVGHYTKANGVWTKNDKSYSTYAEALDALTNPENGQKTTTRRKKQEYFIIDDHYIIK